MGHYVLINLVYISVDSWVPWSCGTMAAEGVGLLSGRITMNTKAQGQIPEQKCFVNAVGERISFLIFFWIWI